MWVLSWSVGSLRCSAGSGRTDEVLYRTIAEWLHVIASNNSLGLLLCSHLTRVLTMDTGDQWRIQDSKKGGGSIYEFVRRT